MNRYITLFLLVLLLYSIYVARQYKKSVEQYYDELGRYRKNIYLLTIFLTILGGALGYFYPDNWKVFVPLAGVSVLIDLAIFQTPNILKIGNAEFQHEDLMKKQMAVYRKTQTLHESKAKMLSSIINQVPDYLMTDDLTTIGDDTQAFIDGLGRFLKKYTDSFAFELSYYVVGDGITPEKLNEIVYRCAVATGTEFTEESKEVLVNRLLLAEGDFLSEKAMLVPYYGYKHNIVILVHSKIDNLISNDVVYLTILANIFDWYVE